ncbi:MAG: hypothetical protein K6D97_01140 [Clostridia bacterium]|nr:hypothetical protein [Clostridia bacterium]
MTPKTTREEHVSVIDSGKKVPKNMTSEIEKRIEEYVEACNDGNYQKAFNFLSADCRKYEYDDNVENFMEHVIDVTPTPRDYATQNYSNITLSDGTNVYIYEIKYFNSFIESGLSNSDYAFTSEKVTFYYDDENQLMMNVGDYIYHSDPDSISENEYLKVDIQDRRVDYKVETYQVLLTNRSQYTIVISDEQENEEVNLVLDNDVEEMRSMRELEHIVLAPGEAKTITVSFQKFVDDGDASKAIVFGHVRVMEKYSGTENIDQAVIDEEKNNSIAQMSVSVPIVNR